jgi:hypothetical protein
MTFNSEIQACGKTIQFPDLHTDTVIADKGETAPPNS